MRNEQASLLGGSMSGDTLFRLEQKTRSTEAMLRQRYSRGGSASEVDLILCHYLYGLVAVAMPAASPTLLLGILRHLGSLVLPSDAVTAALFTQAPGQETSLGRMIWLAEQAGRREGEAIHSVADTTTNDLIEPGASPRDASPMMHQNVRSPHDQRLARAPSHRNASGRSEGFD